MASTEILIRIDAAKEAVLAQVKLLESEFGRVESKWKYDGSRVTAIDVEISNRIFEQLRELFPADQFLSEELAETGAPIPITSRYSWVLDPIDGTNNFALGIVHCAIALALCEHGQPIYGVVYDLSRRTLMHGGPGFGMFDGEQTRRVSSAAVTRETLVGLHSPFDKSFMPQAAAIMSRFKIRALGSATLHVAYVAAGILDACVDYNVKIWDVAAAIPLVNAAGGEVHFLNGAQLPMKEFDLRMKRMVFVAGSPEMCAGLRELMGAGAGSSAR